ncbi:MAG: hypothetical protein V7632_814, partial [Bradyrhizobium sp.]
MTAARQSLTALSMALALIVTSCNLAW